MSNVVQVQMWPKGWFRLRWYDGVTLVATEEWRAYNTEYDPLGNVTGRVVRNDGLTIDYQTSPAEALLTELSVQGGGMPIDVAERIGARYSGVDTTRDWNGLRLVLDDELGNERVVLMGDPCRITPDRGHRTATYELRFHIVETPAHLTLGG